MAVVSLREITETNRDAVLALRVTDEQEPFVGSVAVALSDAHDMPEAQPWARALYADEQPVGFVMLSWNVVPAPPTIIGPWFLWKLLIDRRQQRRGYGRAAIDIVSQVVRAEGATRLLTSYVDAPGGPDAFYAALGFRPTGERDDHDEVIVALDL